MQGLSSARGKQIFAVSALLAAVACGRKGPSAKTDDQTASSEKADAVQGLDVSLFKPGAFAKEPEIVDCETTAGTKTKCYKLVTSGAPAGREPGPFCPRTASDGVDVSGTWFSKEGRGDLVALTGGFIAKLGEYYGDPKWQLVDPATGKIRYTATKEACLGAAKPEVEEQYRQNCVECLMSYLDASFTRTYLIPAKPIVAANAGNIRTVGIALDGAELSAPAPVNAILSSYTIAAFDDCGGHINDHQGYHYHSATGCTNRVVGDDGYAPLIGYAADGYAIYAMRDAQGKEASNLDECRGTTDAVRGYHYRAAGPSENKMIGCLRGEIVGSSDGPPGGPRPPRPRGAPDGPPPTKKPPE